jgi:hypothetical protein
LHHLAWIYIDQNKLSQAWDYGETAHNLYTEISDPRGVSDADEQLGEIASLQGNYTASRHYLISVIKVRRRLENKVGLASASRRLSKVFFKEKKWLRGIFYLTYSACMYARLGMLTSTRIKRWLHT